MLFESEYIHKELLKLVLLRDRAKFRTFALNITKSELIYEKSTDSFCVERNSPLPGDE